MNWYTRNAPDSSWADHELTEKCEHVETKSAAIAAILGEDDSFGPVGRYAVCRTCLTESEAAENAQLKECQDCHTEVRQDKGLHWEWYDFYAPQGDEAYFLCLPCWRAPKHKERMAHDKADFEEEMYGRPK